ncbi:MAG: hypothetical protein JEZ12_13060 [Desulfobacterium sp.]|nr:hypothetical protein [Desulfobacterium sp.]
MKENGFKMPDLHIGLTTFNNDGEKTSDLYEEGHSWVRNGWNLQFIFMGFCNGADALFGAGQLSLRNDVGQIIRYAKPSSLYMDSSSGYSSAIGGIRVGTGGEPFDIEQYDLVARIPNGVSVDQLNHGGVIDPSYKYNDTEKVWTITHSKEFSNLSGASISIAEIGLFWNGEMMVGTQYRYMTARDVLSSPVTVANGEILRVSYEISMDYSSIDS